MSNRRRQIILISVLGLLFLYVIYKGNHSSEIGPVVSSADEKFRPIAVDNPELRIDKLDRLKKLQYTGSHRNIFSATAPPPPAAARPAVTAPAPPPLPSAPSGPAPLVVPATFYGYVADPQTGARRAFFMEGENVYVLAVGEVLLGRFRLVQISNNSAELEELSTGRRATLTMEEPNPS